MAVANQLVSREASNVASEVTRQLESRDVKGLAFIALTTATGVVLAQEIADRILPAVGYPREPTSAGGFAVSAGVKVFVALIVGALAPVGSTFVSALVGFLALGHVVSAGADLFNAIQRTGFLAEQGRSMSTNATTTQSSPSTNSNNGQTAVATDGGVEVRDADCGCGTDEEKEPVTDGGFEPAAGPLGRGGDGGRSAISAGI